MQSDLPCISENRTAAMGCPVFNGMGVFISNISAVSLAFTGRWPLFPAHCTLPIVLFKAFRQTCKGIYIPEFRPRPRPSTVFKTPSAPKRNSPARAPRHTVFAIQYAIMGVHAGEVLARGGLEGTASPKEAAPPRSSSLAGIFSGGSLQGLL